MNAIAQRAEQALQRRRVELTRLRSTNAENDAEVLDARPADWRDRAAETEAAGVLEALAERERAELMQIEDALARVKAGTFGACQRCGGAIGRQRLIAVPYTRYCVTCEETDERGD